MKDFVKLTKDTWLFHLSALFTVLLAVISNNMYVIQDSLQEIDSGKRAHNLAEIFVDKGAGITLTNLYITFVAMAILLIIRYAFTSDKRAQEFQIFLPVKQGTRILYEYTMNLSVFVIGWLISILMYTNKINQLDSGCLQELWKTGVSYLIVLVFLYTALYLGSLLFQNKLAGVTAIVVLYFTHVDTLYWMDELFFDGRLNAYQYAEIALNDSEFIKRTFVFLVLMLIGIAILSKKKEPASGKWLYAMWMDYVVAFLGSFVIFCVLFEWFDAYIAMTIAVVVCVIWIRYLVKSSLILRSEWEVR